VRGSNADSSIGVWLIPGRGMIPQEGVAESVESIRFERPPRNPVAHPGTGTSVGHVSVAAPVPGGHNTAQPRHTRMKRRRVCMARASRGRPPRRRVRISTRCNVSPVAPRTRSESGIDADDRRVGTRARATLGRSDPVPADDHRPVRVRPAGPAPAPPPGSDGPSERMALSWT